MNALHVAERSAVYALENAVAPVAGEVFDLLATAPLGVAKLRELILALAVRGKLLPQDHRDEPASKALARIADAQGHLVADGTIKQHKQAGAITRRDKPFDLPVGWECARLADLVGILNGRAYAKDELLDHGVPVLRVGNLFTSNHWYYSNLSLEPDKYCDTGDLLFAWSASFGPFIWPGPKAIYHYHIWKLNLHSDKDLDKRYLYTFLLKKTQEIKAAGHGVSMLHMTKEKMERVVVPLPPLAEQRRIVARVEELMGLCDELETRGRLQDEQHARLVATLFGALVASASPAELADNWQRIASHFDLLLDRPEAVDALEQTILQLAVHGLLVPQNPADESVDSLLDRIQADRHGSTTRRTAHTHASDRAQLRNQSSPRVPACWRTVPLGDVVELLSGQHLTPAEYSEHAGSGIPYLTGPAEFGAVTPLPTRSTTVRKAVAMRGDILITVKGAGVGKLNTVDQPELAISRQLMAIRPLRLVHAFVFLTLETMYAAFQSKSIGIAIPGISRTDVLEAPIAIPPLAEQHRIVARVEALRGLCADLRQQLQQSQTTQSNLADALVARAAA